jgi:uncharacterized repeat protein (TIGR03803 family)
MRILLSILFCVVLASCTHASASSPLPAGVANAPTSDSGSRGFQTLFSFKGPPDDGLDPHSQLTELDGVFYGTTVGGGDAFCYGSNGCGTVFRITPDGAETTLYQFQGKNDGQNPYGKLIRVGSNLYGTTERGGEPACNHDGDGCGTVFKISIFGNERVIYNFSVNDDLDGQYPVAGLVDVNGTLYGTTRDGGGKACDYSGTVFKVTTSGKEQVVHRFCGASDGRLPTARLLLAPSKNTLYGTTARGGGSTKCPQGCGTVFSIDSSGTEKVLYAFQGGNDGQTPTAGLTYLDGLLYGTTKEGGTIGKGTVFDINPDGSGKEVLYNFQGRRDGASPTSDLTVLDHVLYGTTREGGGTGPCFGTIFGISKDGREGVLHGFCADSNYFAAVPDGGVTVLRGIFYGTTTAGGTAGFGTAYKLTP